MKYKKTSDSDQTRHDTLSLKNSLTGHVKDDRLLSAIHTAAAEFINRESNRRSLVTVTKAAFLDEKNVQIFVSVFPQKDVHAVMDFLKRQEKEFLIFLKKTVKLHFIPKMRFLPDPDMGLPPAPPVEEER